MQTAAAEIVRGTVIKCRRPEMTKAIMYAASSDMAAKARRNGADQEQQAQAFQDEFDRLFAAIGGVEAWIDLPLR